MISELLEMSVNSAKQNIDPLGNDAKGESYQTHHQKAFFSTLAFWISVVV